MSNRFHFLKGLTYEQIGETGKALDTYYYVISRENLPEGETPTEWFWYEDCGFNLLALLEQSERTTKWRAMVNVAAKIAAAGGPRSAEAAKRKKSLQLEHLIWDEE